MPGHFFEVNVAYEVIARKWRPKSFLDLVGQTHISQTLTNALKNKRLPHALLFTGPRGTGKTSSARILAKALRCPEAKDFVPCGVCAECEDIASSRSVDVIEIDGASNNGVDAIRELRDTVGYMPSSGSHKVYIIDEVHMLSGSAFNALLKTLEEPPEHVIFVMATTEAHKIPNTILSRCQRFDMRRISTRLIFEHLKQICQQEKVKVDDEALWMLSRQADGSMRDSQSLLDQVISFSEGNINLEKLVEVLGLTDRNLLLQTIEALIERDNKQIVDVIEKIFVAGYDPVVYMKDLLEELRHLLLVKLNPQQIHQIVDLPDTEIERLKSLSEKLGQEDIHLLFDMALKGANDLPRTQDTQVVLEMLLLRMAAAPRIQNLLALSGPSAGVSSQAVAQPSAPQVTSASSPPQPASTAPPTPAPPSDSPAAPLPAAGSPQEKWSELVKRIAKVNSIVAAKLENSYLIDIQGKVVQVGVPTKMKFLYDQINDGNFQRKLKNYLNTFWGPGYSIEVSLGSGAAEKKTPQLTPKQIEIRKSEIAQNELKAKVEAHPLVKSANEVFETEISSIKEI